MPEYEIECTECGWSGNQDELLCSDTDFNDKEKKASECKFNICPECGESGKFEDLQQD